MEATLYVNDRYWKNYYETICRILSISIKQTCSSLTSLINHIESGDLPTFIIVDDNYSQIEREKNVLATLSDTVSIPIIYASSNRNLLQNQYNNKQLILSKPIRSCELVEAIALQVPKYIHRDRARN